MVSMRVTFHVTLWDKVACWAVTPLQVSDHCLWLTPAQWSLGTGYNMLSNIVSHWDWFSDSHSFNFNQPMAIPFNVTLNICFLFYININKGTVCLSVVSWLPKSKFNLKKRWCYSFSNPTRTRWCLGVTEVLVWLIVLKLKRVCFFISKKWDIENMKSFIESHTTNKCLNLWVSLYLSRIFSFSWHQ